MNVEEVVFEGPDYREIHKLALAARIQHVVNKGSVCFPVKSYAAAKTIVKKLQEMGPDNGLSGSFKLQASQRFITLVKAPPEAQIQAMQAFVDKKIGDLKITVYKISKSSCGLAWIEQRRIKIPRVKDVDTFCVCLHEIGHILNGRIRPVYASEYHTEQQALRLAKEFAEQAGLTNDEQWIKALRQYENRAKGYVMLRIAEGYAAGLRVGKILPEVKRWLGYDFSAWPGNKVEVDHYASGYHVKLTPAK